MVYPRFLCNEKKLSFLPVVLVIEWSHAKLFDWWRCFAVATLQQHGFHV